MFAIKSASLDSEDFYDLFEIEGEESVRSIRIIDFYKHNINAKRIKYFLIL